MTLLKKEFLLPKALLLEFLVYCTAAFFVVSGALIAIFIFEDGFSFIAGFI
jgi:hypothetical protein